MSKPDPSRPYTTVQVIIVYSDEGSHSQFLFKFPALMTVVVNVSVDSAILGLQR